MIQVTLAETDVKNALFCIRVVWEAGFVKSEAQGATLSELRLKFEEALKPPANNEAGKK